MNRMNMGVSALLRPPGGAVVGQWQGVAALELQSHEYQVGGDPAPAVQTESEGEGLAPRWQVYRQQLVPWPGSCSGNLVATAGGRLTCGRQQRRKEGDAQQR